MDKKLTVFKIGFFCLMLGMITADSECLAIPASIAALGLYLMWRGAKNAR